MGVTAEAEPGSVPRQSRPEVFFSLGANLGDPPSQLREALRGLGHSARLLAVSSVYRTQPLGRADQPEFYNLVCSARTQLSPYELLRAVLEVETRMGRRRTHRDEPRVIDIDILAYGGLVLDSPELVLPHPRLHRRNFVLIPLREIAPGWRHPVTGRPVEELIRAGSEGGVERLYRLEL